MMLNPKIAQARGLAQTDQLFSFKTSQYRKRAVVAEQAVLQHQFSQCCVEEVRHWIAMEIDHEDAVSCHSAHLPQDVHNLFIDEVMREERTHHVIKLRPREG